MQRLSDTTLIDIFCHTVVGPVVIPAPATDTRAYLLAVCHKWRILIESSPCLWRDVVFLPVVPAGSRQLSDLWLQRSQGVLVSIKFDQDFQTLQPRIKPNIHRTTRRIIALTGTLATDATIRAFFTIPPSLFLSLEKVDLVLVNQFTHHRSLIQPWEYNQFSVFRNLPFLRDVTVHLLNWAHPYHLGLPWNQLTSIDLGTMPMPPDVFLTIVRMAANSLTNVRFQVKFSNQPIPSPGVTSFIFPFQPIIANILEKLHLIVINPIRDTRMFSVLRAPFLTSLRIELEDVTNGWNPEIFIPMLQMMPSLQSLALAPFFCRLRQRSLPTVSSPHNIVSNSNMETFFNAIPTVRDLDLELGLQIGSLTWERLAQGKFLPLLESFRCGSVIGLHVLSAIQRRNQLAEGKTSSGSSQTVARAVVYVLKAITSLHLVVPHDDLLDVTASAYALREQPSTANTVFVVEGANLRLFYNIECLNYLPSKENR